MKRICKHCNEEFEVLDWRQVFCCPKHYREYHRKLRLQQRLKEKQCVYCGETFFTNKTKICCSDEHYVLYRKQYKNQMAKDKKAIDPNFKLANNLRRRCVTAIKRKSGIKHGTTIELLGCSVEECRQYLESLFLENMTWNNHGMGNDKWHIDHIIPCDFFDLTKKEEQKKCFHYTNLQPLWQPDNLRKSNKV